ncbi:DUF6314 family protein [Chelatococcus sp. GCM10030263]|uniref:DUF6314 family protein n=1 Tax=Chelatococcus sp. GCM10030263 TaxID=3273387 RepID=UPI00360D5D64
MTEHPAFRADLRHAFFDRLPGSWNVYRTIDRDASLDGVATIAAIARDRLSYREEGVLRLPGAAPISAHRSYVYERRPNGFAILFDEVPVRPFQAFTLTARPDGALSAVSRHLCGDDLYETTCVVQENAFWLIHRVTGPRKAYVSTTRYAPCAAALSR